MHSFGAQRRTGVPKNRAGLMPSSTVLH